MFSNNLTKLLVTFIMILNTQSATAAIVDITISGLQYQDLAAFDLNVNFNPNQNSVAIEEYSLTNALGRFDLYEAFDLSTPYTSNSNIVNLSVLSLLDDLSWQPETFTLASIEFTTEDDISPNISLSEIILSDTTGNYIPFSVSGSNINVSAVPLPSTILLLGVTLILFTTFENITLQKRFRINNAHNY